MRPARRAPALRIRRAGILSVPGILDRDGPAPGKELAVARIPGRQDAVEQIDAPGDALDEVVGHPGPHQIAWRPGRKPVCRVSRDVVHDLGRLPHRQPADGVGLEADRKRAGHAFIAQVLVRAALDDPELRLAGSGTGHVRHASRRQRLEPVAAAPGPPQRPRASPPPRPRASPASWCTRRTSSRCPIPAGLECRPPIPATGSRDCHRGATGTPRPPR